VAPPLPHFLLIGAGFTRNWGGPLSDEVTGSLLGDLHDDTELAAALRRGPFEEAFQGFQRLAGSAKVSDSQRRLQDAVINLFTRLNRTLLELRFDFTRDKQFSIRDFLAKFDAIFSLNQDLLLEIHYRPDFGQRGRWNEAAVPGMRAEQLEGSEHYGVFAEYWVPTEGFEVKSTSQPFLKLHGSTNWRAASGELMLIMGNQKSGAIESFPVLRRYHDYFSSSIGQLNAKLMVIGYSFQDEHINNVIADASARHGLGTYLVDPRGRDALADPRMASALIKGPRRDIEEIKLIGELRRPLSAVFGGDRFAHQELMRFFR
jgi:hypothetical protein